MTFPVESTRRTGFQTERSIPLESMMAKWFNEKLLTVDVPSVVVAVIRIYRTREEAVLVFGAGFVFLTVKLYKSEDLREGLRVFAFSILYLFVIFAALIADRKIYG